MPSDANGTLWFEFLWNNVCIWSCLIQPLAAGKSENNRLRIECVFHGSFKTPNHYVYGPFICIICKHSMKYYFTSIMI